MTGDALILAVTKAQRRDTRAFDTLVRQFQNSAVGYARTLLRDPAAAEDAAQEALVQAWRDLPSLAEPAAFGAWLRRIVFKFCDRVRRSARPTLLLDETLPLPTDQEPPWLAEHAEDAARVREAIQALPAALAEVTLLYYLTGHDIKEIAAFLELPSSTVKNRLHAARKRLRKELWIMAETVLEEEKPSQSETFAENVLARVLREFQQQEVDDPRSVNRGLLEEGRSALFERLRQNAPLETPSLRDGFLLLWRKLDFPALSSLLMRYLSQSPSDSEAVWAYIHLANALAMSGSAAGAVLAHEAFERWMPGKLPLLSARWPYYPASKDTLEPAYVGEEVRLLFLAQSGEFATSYLSVWRGTDYLEKVDAALADIPVTSKNRYHRFFVLRMACTACEAAEDWESAGRYIQQMHILADEAEEDVLRAELQSKALGHGIRLAQAVQDETAFTNGITDMIALLNAPQWKTANPATWLRGERHDLACRLVGANLYASALPLWEANAASGGQLGGGWGWLLYAATLWQLTQDREQTLSLLQEARAHDDRDMVPLFVKRPEFADVREDLQFKDAIGEKETALVL